MAGAPYRVFYSYSHADVHMLEKLRKHMAMLKRQGWITEWYDHDIEAGSEWRDEIERELQSADVILLLVSADFLASDFCYEQEMVRAVDRARRGEALVIGVMLRPVNGWDSTPFAEFQLVPRDARPISKWPNADEAYSDVVERIRAVLEERARTAPAETDTSFLTADQETQLAKISDPAMPDSEVFSPTELAVLDQILDPEQHRMKRDEMAAAKASSLRGLYQTLAQMRRQVSEVETTDVLEPDS